ncbi:transcription factor Tfb4 [Heliocybe sulcata]|uniref:General transcription and DNA repair factor IIH subunit TFB4 n=1 Tax=Heliocybe sulcata TaxID=5364 RepID=A0A5C3NA08_9AGAM|nr:transcription factor Tfb4 [Heliocybe sulcata]
MDQPSHISVILDLSPSQWHLSSLPQNPYPLSLKSFLAQVLAFLNLHIASKHENTLAIFGAFPGKSVMLYSSTDPASDSSDSGSPNIYRPFEIVDSRVVTRIEEELESIDDSQEEAPIGLVGALTKALCYINRIKHPTPSTQSNGTTVEDPATLPDPRILILSVSPDLSTSYIPIMNSIFSAQKLKIIIDVCKIYGPDTVFLEQAAHLTGGSYVYLERRDALLQHLVMSHLPSPALRKLMAVPTQDKIDFRAACFCHKNIVDVGFVCSVCLSIFCRPVAVCTTCRTKFPMSTLRRLDAYLPRAAKQANGTAKTSAPPTPTATGLPSTPR